MTTRKVRITVWLRDTSELEELFDQVRQLAPIEARGVISRSTCVEAAVAVALRDIEARGRESDVFKALVTTGNVTAGESGNGD